MFHLIIYLLQSHFVIISYPILIWVGVQSEFQAIDVKDLEECLSTWKC